MERDSSDTSIARDEVLMDVIDKVYQWLDGLEADLPFAPELDELVDV